MIWQVGWQTQLPHDQTVSEWAALAVAWANPCPSFPPARRPDIIRAELAASESHGHRDPVLFKDIAASRAWQVGRSNRVRLVAASVISNYAIDPSVFQLTITLTLPPTDCICLLDCI